MAVHEPPFVQDMQRVPAGQLIRPTRKTNGAGVQVEDTRICVVMVGLPARGKSYIAQKGIATCATQYALIVELTAVSISRSIPPLAFNQCEDLQCRPVSPSKYADP